MSVYEVGLLVTYVLFALIVGISFVVSNNKAEKNKSKWRDDCLNELTEIKVYLKSNAEQTEEIVKALMYDK